MSAANTPLAMPYPGLRPFEAEDQPLFFGREAQVSGMLRQLEDHRFVAVVGSSGSGKSSLVRAGLLPAVHEGFLLGTTDWLTVVIKPGHQPYRRLVRALRRATGAAGEASPIPRDDEPLTAEENAMIATLRRTDRGLVTALGELPVSPESRIIVVVDQFEELFAFRRAGMNRDSVASRDEAAAFVGMLLRSASESAGRVWVVLTMRSDFIGDCETFLGLPEQISHSQFLVPRLDRGQMEEAIRRPAAVREGGFRSFTFVDGLANRIINDAGDRPDQLPLMQHALMRTWKRAVARAVGSDPVQVTIPDYEAAGGIDMALSLHADAAWDEIKDDPKKADLARRLFLLLCDVSPDGQITRRRPQVAEIQSVTGASVAEIEQIVRVFQRDDRNFLLPPPPQPLTAESYLDISHEALLRQWRRFAGEWQERERRDASELRRLAELAGLRKQGQGVGLLPTQDLERIARWKERVSPAWAHRYVTGDDWDEALRFVSESQSQAEQEREEEQREADRKREEEQRQKQAEQKKKFLYAVASILLIAMVFSMWKTVEARRAGDRAETERRVAEKAKREALNANAAAEKATNDAQEALTRPFLRTIGSSYGALPTLDERESLWDLAALASTNVEVRRKVIDVWFKQEELFKSVELSGKALRRHAQGLHAAVGLDEKMREHAVAEVRRLAGGLADQMAKEIEIDRLSKLGSSLAALATQMEAKDAASLVTGGAQILREALVNTQEIDADGLSKLGAALAGLVTRMEAKEAADVAATGAPILLEAIEKLAKISPDQLESLGIALAALAGRVEASEAGIFANRIVSAMDPKKRSAARLAAMGTALEAFAARMEAKDAESLATTGANILAGVLENPKAEDAYQMWGLGKALAALAARTNATDAGSFADRLAKVLANPKTTDASQLASLGTAVAGLAVRMEPTDAASVAKPLAGVLADANTTDASQLPALGAAVAALAARMEPEVAASFAEPLAKVLENPQETLGVRLWSFGPAMAALASRMEAKEASRFATRLTKALVNPQETNGDRLWGLREALPALAARMDAEAAAGAANELVIALEKSPDTFADRRWSLGNALAAAAARMEPKAAASVAARGAWVLANAMDDPKEADGGRLPDLARSLGVLSGLIPGARETQLAALSNILLKKVSSPPERGEKDPDDRKELAAIYALLKPQDLAEVLKWPLCVDEARKMALAELEKRTARKFDGAPWKFVKQFDSLKIKGPDGALLNRAFLNEPAKRPRMEDAMKELKKFQTPATAKPNERPR